MATLINGKDLIVFFRRFEDRATQDAGKVRFQTEHTLNTEKETESTITKDGNVNTITDGESSGEFTSLAYREEDPETINMWRELRKWYKANDLVEVWQVDLGSKDKSGKYDVEYYQGYFSNFEISAPADDKVELSYEMVINGNGIEAKDTLTETQLAAVEAAMYDYHTLAAEGAAEGTDEEEV